MLPEEQNIVEAKGTTEIVENTNIENKQNQQTEISGPVVQIQQTVVNGNNVASTNSKTKKMFMIGTEESPKDNRETNDSTSNTEVPINSESHMDTKQKIDSEEEDDYVNIINKISISNQINSEPDSQQPIQQPTPKDEKDNGMNSSESSKPLTMTPTEPHQAAPVVTNTTVTAVTTTQRHSTPVNQPAKFILSTPEDSSDSTPSPPTNDLSSQNPNVSCINPPLLNLALHLSSQNPDSCTNDEPYASESLNYPHQPRFPPSSSGMSRTQQKLLLQRQHFLADDENYLIHPRNQLRLTKVIERINREHVAISLYRNPIIESLQRVWPKYVQEHPEVLEDDFGVGYDDSKEWGVISDHGKNMDHIGSINTETLGVDSMPLRGIK